MSINRFFAFYFQLLKIFIVFSSNYSGANHSMELLSPLFFRCKYIHPFYKNQAIFQARKIFTHYIIYTFCFDSNIGAFLFLCAVFSDLTSSFIIRETMMCITKILRIPKKSSISILPS